MIENLWEIVQFAAPLAVFMIKFGVYLIMIGLIITAITAILERNWKNAVVAILFTIANAMICLW